MTVPHAIWRTVGHGRAVASLQRGLLQGRLSHAYLLTGPAHVGKMTLALDVARMVNCRGEAKPCSVCNQCRRISDGLHADVRVLRVEAQPTSDGRRRVAIGIDQVRDVQRDASLKPYEGAYRVFIFDGAERLSEEAANSLLKILEEPPEQVILVLLASEADGLLPTVVSRCQLVELRPMPMPLVAQELEARHGLDRQRAEGLARLSGGRLGWALAALEQPAILERRTEILEAIDSAVRGGLEGRLSYAASLASLFGENREAARQELALWLEWWRDVLMIKEDVPGSVANVSRLEALQAIAQALSSAQIVEAAKATQEAIEHLELNVNPRLALEVLMLALPRP